jgi:GNAT superfamily N-acetyltransferase
LIEEAIRRDEIEGARRSIEAARRLDPDAGATSIEVAGGLVAFAGVDSPLSQALGVGAPQPVSASDIAKITEFYESRGAIPMVFVTPAADPSLQRELTAAGYVAGDREQSLLASDDLVSHAQRDARIGVAHDIAAWAKASASGFLEREQLEPGEDVIALILATTQGTVALEVRDGHRIISTGAVSVSGEHATLFAGSTHTAFRRQGWHAALIRDRVARAREAGARLVRATAGPGSASERNFLRCGFVKLYMRVLWERKASEPSAALLRRSDSDCDSLRS